MSVDEEIVDVVSSEEESEETSIDFWNYCTEGTEGYAVCSCCNQRIATKFKGSEGKVARVRLHFNVDQDGNMLMKPKSKKRKICRLNPFSENSPSKRQTLMSERLTPRVAAADQHAFNVLLRKISETAQGPS
jgi:hypothetical protein